MLNQTVKAKKIPALKSQEPALTDRGAKHDRKQPCFTEMLELPISEFQQFTEHLGLHQLTQFIGFSSG